MGCESGGQGGGGQAFDIAPSPDPYEAVHHDDLAPAASPPGRCDSTSTCVPGSV